MFENVKWKENGKLKKSTFFEFGSSLVIPWFVFGSSLVFNPRQVGKV